MPAQRFPVASALLLLLAVVVVFFPSLFFGRVMSPLDTVRSSPPWQGGASLVEVTNPELREAATTPVARILQASRQGRATAVWDPYVACGGPGTLSWDSGTLSPCVLPWLGWLDETRLVNATVLSRLLLALVGTFVLLRRLGHEEVAAGTGAVVFALSGPLVAWWLWPASATLAALPLLLVCADGLARGEARVRSLLAVAVAWLVLLAGGSRGGSLAAVVAVVLWLASRVVVTRGDWRGSVRAGAGVALGAVIALAVLAPSLGLALRAPAAVQPAGDETAGRAGLGWRVVRLLVDPLADGDPRQDTYAPLPGQVVRPFRETCVAVGTVAAALALIGAAVGRRRAVPWVLLVAVGLLGVGWTPVRTAAALVPGLAAADVSHLAAVAALGLAGLAAVASSALARIVPAPVKRTALGLLAVAVVLEQGLFAGHMMAYLPADEARLPMTPGLELVAERVAREPARVAPVLDTLWPDTAAVLGLEDVRAQRPVPTGYRDWLRAVDPQVWGYFGRTLRLNAATVDLLHPYLSILGARFILEPPEVRLVEYALGRHLQELEPRTELLGPLGPAPVIQGLTVPPDCSRLGVQATGTGEPLSGAVRVALVAEDGAAELAAVRVEARTVVEEGVVWLDVPESAPGRTLQLRVTASEQGSGVWLWRTPRVQPPTHSLQWEGRTVPGALALALDLSGFSLLYEGRDLRVWENRRAAPRLWLVHRVVAGTLPDVLAARPPLDLRTVAVVPPAVAAELGPRLSEPAVSGRITVTGHRPGAITADVDVATGGLLVSSVAATGGLWRARVDGEPRVPVEVNGLFVAVPVPAGRHRVELAVGLPRLWYVGSLAGALTLLALAAVAGRRTARPGGPGVRAGG